MLGAGLAVAGCQSTGATPPSAPVTAAAAPAAAFPFGGTTWRVEEIDGRPAGEPGAPTVTFDGVQRVAGSTGCNRYSAPVEVSGPAMRVGVIVTTRMACPPAVMDQEGRFVTALAAIRGYRQDGDALRLVDESGRTLLRLVRG